MSHPSITNLCAELLLEIRRLREEWRLQRLTRVRLELSSGQGMMLPPEQEAARERWLMGEADQR
jgi:hypothetical protein